MKYFFLLILLVSIKAYAQFIPFAFWNTQDICNGDPPIGTVCANGTIYGGIYSGGKYFVTPGNCTNSSTPTCNGATDSLKKIWHGGGAPLDVPGVETVSSESDASSVLGSVNTPLIAAASFINPASGADYCNDMVYGGKSDWYLPSKSELAYIYCKNSRTGHNSSYPQESPNCSGFGGRQYLIPGFRDSAYISSTQGTVDTRVIGQFFHTGEQDSDVKGDTNTYIRCVRRQ